MRTPEALKVVSPKAFGYPDIEFVPLQSSCSAKPKARAMPELQLIRLIDVPISTTSRPAAPFWGPAAIPISAS